MPDSASIEITVHAKLADISAAGWDACACPEAGGLHVSGPDTSGRPVDPFTTHRFLLALETSGSVGPGTGWQAQHLVARLDGEIIAVAPLYAKSHSQGEYIFDHN